MGKIIGVQFQKNGKMYYFDANGLDARPGEYVIVDTARGIDLGEVAMGTSEADSEVWHTPLKKAVRMATEQDIQRSVDNRVKEKEAFSICQKKIAEHKLEMKLVSVEYTFDNSKILFFFTANGRVDFRSLVKDLASIFKMRIELRQIGVRDEAKMLGGLGPCGRPICCGAFLDQFQPVSIKMAKEQNLSLNPTKISGVCGRLMCCLKYEQEHYEMTRKKMPKIGREVITPDGNGPVTDLNIVKETVFVRLTNGDTSEIKEYPLESITRPNDPAVNADKTAQPRKEPSPAREEKGRKTEAVKEEESGIPQEKAVREQKAGSAQDKQSREQKSTPQENVRNEKRRSGALGQPVRRENPNRAAADKPAREETKAKETAEPVQPAEKPTASAKPVSAQEKPAEKPAQQSAEDKKKSSWADALQKAMEAIGKDNQ